MNNFTAVKTKNAPGAIGTYSQAVIAGDLMFVSGQIPLLPDVSSVIGGGIAEQARQVFCNIQAIAKEANVGMKSCMKINISMTDLSGFDEVNTVMQEFFQPPYPARACVGVASLPKGALIEVESIFYLNKME